MSWKGKLTETGAEGSLRDMSEPHDFDPADFQAGAFAVGAEYKGVLTPKDEQIGALTEKGWQGKLRLTS